MFAPPLWLSGCSGWLVKSWEPRHLDDLFHRAAALFQKKHQFFTNAMSRVLIMVQDPLSGHYRLHADKRIVLQIDEGHRRNVVKRRFLRSYPRLAKQDALVT